MGEQPTFKLNKPALFQNKSLVDGAWLEAKSGKRFDVIDPGTGQPWTTAPDNDASDVEEAVQAAHRAFLGYRRLSPLFRYQCLLKWGSLIREHRDDLAQIVTYETGKPITDAQFEIDYAQSAAWWFAGEAERIHGTAFDSSVSGKKVMTVKQPIGVAAALVPWNYPVAMILRKAGAALAAGCTMMIKPSPETPLSVLTLALLAEEGGFPKGVLNVLPTSLKNTPEVSEALCHHPLVRKVTFTGSTRIGKLIAKLCTDGMKKVALELGGNCPFIIFSDASLVQAADALMNLKWRNAGQACISANRVYVQSDVYDQFAEILMERTAKLVVGHGSLPSSTMGPVTTPQSLDRARSQVEDARKHGASIALGGDRVKDMPGFFFQPTIILDATKEMRVTQEETFAPIVTLYRFETEEEAIEAANDTSMGLASYVFTKNIDRAFRLVEDLEAGMIGLNTSSISAADSPFGGIKESGYGKEAGKDVAVEEYLVTKVASFALESRV
ncbi:succinate-semialdehyde dehydrogenase [Capronia coronata CBS 617.96]|uniref:Succinate-semialdehyde dehydrogenase n=1 Tax=Capronia coronata CBS 617.96 TaxID=1182541 RepID=W9XEP5_9EURO|nr:succinate-semialdehyde dehydrogenase [Capronia coronata CBS 617.96]EXJ78708.1 succinate-semialdehyde dehydrogenase [Capronia coronata CBS 617.96]